MILGRAVAVASVTAALALSSSGSWGLARQIVTPPTRANSPGGIASVSCAHGGYCVAFGTYEVHGVPFGADVPYVTTENKNGTWSKIKPIPGIAALVPGKTPRATARGVACPSAGNCSAYGLYLTTARGAPSSFVVSEQDGVWGPAKPVPALGSMNATAPPEITTLACQSAGNCVAGGFYDVGSQVGQAFVIREVNSVWGSAQNPPGIAVGPSAPSDLLSVACPLKGACAALGAEPTGLFANTESEGGWNAAKTVRGDTPGALTCAPTGRCVVAASFGLSVGTYSELGGVWGKVQHIAVPPISLVAQNISIACPQVGNCSIAWDTSQFEGESAPAFVATQTYGKWGKPIMITGLGRVGAIVAAISGIACGEPGNCSAAGFVFNLNSLTSQAFLVGQSRGIWHKGFLVPGITRLDRLGTSINSSIACWARFHCVAGGQYTRATKTNAHAFVVTER